MEGFFDVANDVLTAIDDFVWGVPLMTLILAGGILLTARLAGLQFRQLPRALRYMMKNEKGRLRRSFQLRRAVHRAVSDHRYR